MAKIILTQEVSGLGSAGDVVEVKDGYARNYLLPQGVAIRWTKGAEREVESIRAARSKRAARDLDHAGEIKGKLEAATVSLKVRAGKDGRLFGAVTVADIAGALEATTGESIDKRTIAVGNPIKTLGNHSVAVRLHDEVTAAVALNVVPA
jgi:large subunit ribosomal protein L9